MNESKNSIIIYQPHADQPAIDVRLEGETVWLSQRQMSVLFDTSSDNVGLHLKNIYAEGELLEEATTEDFSVVRQEMSGRLSDQNASTPLPGSSDPAGYSYLPPGVLGASRLNLRAVPRGRRASFRY